MSGTINSAPAPAGKSGLTNPLLQQTEAAIQAHLKPDNLVDYNKIVVAGLHIVLAKGPLGFMAKLKDAPDPIGMCARGAVSLVMVMDKEIGGKMPQQAAGAAGFTLMLHGLDFIDRSGAVKIGEPELDRAATLFANNLFHQQGITPGMLQHATGKVHELAQDPAAMRQIQLKSGMLRDPTAPVPSAIPGVPTT